MMLQACQKGPDYAARAACVPELYIYQGFHVQATLAEGVTGTLVAALQGLGMAIHRDVLPRNACAGGRCQKQNGVGDVLWRNQRAQRRDGGQPLTHCSLALAGLGRLGGNHPVNALAADRARADAVHPHMGRAQLLRQRAGQAADGPLGRRIGRTPGKAVLPAGRRHVDDGAAALPAQDGRRRPGAQKTAVQVNRQATLPVSKLHVLQQRRGAGHASVVDQNVQPAQVLQRGLEQRRHLRLVGHIAHLPGHLRVAQQRRSQRGGINVADVHPGAGGGKGLRRDQADAAGSGGDQHALAGVAGHDSGAGCDLGHDGGSLACWQTGGVVAGNLRYVRLQNAIVQQAVGQLPRGNNMLPVTRTIQLPALRVGR